MSWKLVADICWKLVIVGLITYNIVSDQRRRRR